MLAPVWAQGPRSLLVVVPEGTPLASSGVERWVGLLKVERDRARLSADDAPILRLWVGNEQHRRVLQKLGLLPVEEVRTYLCRRDSQGWPDLVLSEFSVDRTADQIFSELQEPTAVSSSSTLVSVEPTVGLLLVYAGRPPETVEGFLEELGRYWLQRYGRVRPSPYPLASYDSADPEIKTALEVSFPELMDGEFPVGAVCQFVNGKPVRVLQLFRDFQTPASLVREISSARGRALTSSGQISSGQIGTQERARDLPPVQSLGLSDRQEILLLVSRVNETAQQLWNGVKEDQNPKNEGPRRLLLSIIEESRRYLAGESEALPLLRESLRDYAVEPLILPSNAPLTGLSSRFSGLSKALEANISDEI